MSSYSSLDHSVQHVLAGASTDQLRLSRQAADRSALLQALPQRPHQVGSRPSVRWVWRRVRRVATRPA